MTMIKLKNILSEAYAWERQEGKALPTLAEVQAAYEAKMQEEAKPDYIDLDGDGNEEESMKDAAADMQKKAEQNPKDGKSKEDLPSKDLAMHQMRETDDENHGIHADMLKHDNDAKETDLDVLNMGSLEESTFWGRVKGNLKGHEYILREAFRK